jgi:hypothetical protein
MILTIIAGCLEERRDERLLGLAPENLKRRVT